MSRLLLRLICALYCTVFCLALRHPVSFNVQRSQGFEIRPKKWYNWNEVPDVSKKWSHEVDARAKKWYNWNELPEVSKKWYDWQEMPNAEKRAAGLEGLPHNFDAALNDNRFNWRLNQV